MSATVSVTDLDLADEATVADLATFVGRARRVDPEGCARLTAHGDVLAVYVSPVHEGGAPMVLGLRTLALATSSGVDVTVPLAGLADRLARPTGTRLPLPPTVAGERWVGVSPPRGGWQAQTTVAISVLAQAARDGVAAVAAGTPDVVGAPAVAALRARVWSVPIEVTPTLAVPAGAAFAAEALGFLGGEAVSLWRAGSWQRLSSDRGHVLVRNALL